MVRSQLASFIVAAIGSLNAFDRALKWVARSPNYQVMGKSTQIGGAATVTLNKTIQVSFSFENGHKIVKLLTIRYELRTEALSAVSSLHNTKAMKLGAIFKFRRPSLLAQKKWRKEKNGTAQT